MIDIEELKYPNGKFKPASSYTDDERSLNIQTIAELPALLTLEVENLNSTELGYHYRPEGWNIKQVVHHLADSHMNAFIRFKLALTEENPTIKPYLEPKWALLADGVSDNISPSLSIIKGVHHRFALLLNSLSENDFKLTFQHPESKRSMSLEFALSLYSWHSKQHLAHIKNAKVYKY